MKVKVAETAGFCFGVKRAVDKVYQLIEESELLHIYTLGPIIHNEEVVADLAVKRCTGDREKDIDTPSEAAQWNCGDPFPWCRQTYLSIN